MPSADIGLCSRAPLFSGVESLMGFQWKESAGGQ
jgi:hypothetical protein